MRRFFYFSGLSLLMLSPTTCSYEPDGSVTITSDTEQQTYSTEQQALLSVEGSDLLDHEPIIKPRKP